ncbi:MAG: 1-aminocyclopropane-1-carboxylate deaminase [Rhodospirillaceae bacterium]|nr:1-aminocyclopropane-1-carboxylate deaminase [Rhodospirillaceae bacterium]
MEMLREANQLEEKGKNIIHLEVGEPSAGAPSAVYMKAQKILDEKKPIPYTDALGISILRERISEYYKSSYDVIIPYQNIIITTGTSAGFVLSLLSAFDVGDKVAISVPGYPAYKNILISLGLNPVEITTNKNQKYQPTLIQIKKLGNIDGIIVASPSNPTGSIFDDKELEEITNYCDKKGIRILSDEIYHGITYEKKALSIAGISKSGIILNGFSKYFCMTGWRVGWLIVPDELIKPIEKLSQNLFISTNALSQMAAVDAFDCNDELQEIIKKYKINRDILIDSLNHMGISNIAPCDGAFYIYADISHLTENSMLFCKDLLNNAGVAITPGIDFDQTNGKSFVRFSYSCDEENIVEASKRMLKWVKQINI